MGLMDKVKGFFFDEEEIEEEVEIPKKVRNIEKKEPKIKKEETKEIPERELFRAERTFNFPMDMDDEEPDFVPVKPSIKEQKNEKTNVEPVRREKVEVRRENVQTTVRRPYSAKIEKKEEEKKFKPTPIISPIYGIVDGSLPTKKETSSLNETKEFSITKKVDFDTVRKKAYGDIHADDEDDNKGLFYNLVDEEKEEPIVNEEDIELSKESEDDDEIKITYNDVDDYEESEDDEEVEIPKITRLKKNKEETDEDAILSDTKEQDLFNLIDNMYNSEEDEEEDE